MQSLQKQVDSAPVKTEPLSNDAGEQYDDVDLEKMKKWRKWQRGWDIPVIKDGRPWGRMDERAREADYESKKEIMDESDRMLQKALSHRQRSTLKTAFKNDLDDMQNALVKPKYKVWNRGPHMAKGPKVIGDRVLEEVKKKMNSIDLPDIRRDGAAWKVIDDNNDRRRQDPSSRHDLKSLPRNLGRGGGGVGGGGGQGGGQQVEISNDLDGGFRQRMVRAPVVDRGDGARDLRAVLGGFDTEGYLAPQRMLKGHGDPMRAFQFNQVASDATPPDRLLKDYRDSQ